VTHAAAIIGGGATLWRRDFAPLRGFYRIGVNKSAWSTPCEALVTLDGRFEDHYRDSIARFPGLRVSAGVAADPLPGLVRCARGPRTGLSDAWTHLNGDNSGHAALNVAVLLGFRTVYLLGFDFSDVWRHWHVGYPKSWVARAAHASGQWAADLDACAPLLAERGIAVFNVTVPGGSALRAFPEAALDDFLPLLNA
jgi:hypothetical protein